MIKQRRLNWLGDLVRLDINTPARESLERALNGPIDKKEGLKATWLEAMFKVWTCFYY